MVAEVGMAFCIIVSTIKIMCFVLSVFFNTAVKIIEDSIQTSGRKNNLK